MAFPEGVLPDDVYRYPGKNSGGGAGERGEGSPKTSS